MIAATGIVRIKVISGFKNSLTPERVAEMILSKRAITKDRATVIINREAVLKITRYVFFFCNISPKDASTSDIFGITIELSTKYAESSHPTIINIIPPNNQKFILIINFFIND